MKKLLVCVATLSCVLVAGSSCSMAQCHSGGSGFGISLNYGNGYSNFGGAYSGGYSQPSFDGYGVGYGGVYGNGGYFGGGYPAYRSVQVYSTPIYGGGNYGGNYFGGYGGGFGHHHHHHH